MKSFFSSKFFYVITFLTLAAVIIPTTLASMGLTGVLRSGVNIILTPIRNLSIHAVNAIDGYASYFTEFDELVAENEALRRENDALREEVHKSRELREQNEWISEYLELKRQHTDYKMTPADVCGRESGDYSPVYMLDTGSQVGIKRNMPVVTGDGVLGYISEVGRTWSKVTTVIEAGTAIGAYVERSGEIGVLEGEYELSREGLCRLSYLTADADISVGDRILTSGYGSIYPRGLIVGYVERVEVNEFSRSLTAYVRPASLAGSTTREISQVMVITDYEIDTPEQ